jgi:hypothetical protein
MTAIDEPTLPLARLMHGIPGSTCHADHVAITVDTLTASGRLTARLAAAGWAVWLNVDDIPEIVATKRHASLHTAVAELLALEAGGTVYLDAPDQCSTIAYADLDRPAQHHPVDAPPTAGEHRPPGG